MDILQLKDLKTVADPLYPYSKNLRISSVPIVIDNGKQYISLLHNYLEKIIIGNVKKKKNTIYRNSSKMVL